MNPFVKYALFLPLYGLFSHLNYTNAPRSLWVGYECQMPPRTPGLQGKITKSFIAQFLPQNPIIVEAGAHNGSDTVEFARLFPAGSIYSFEPVPSLFAQLQNKTNIFSNVHIFRKALSDKIGYATFYISGGNSDGGSSSLLEPTGHIDYHPDISFRQALQVETITLDSWAKVNNIRSIDFLWLDMQGSEPTVLKASPQILKTVKVIYTEVNLVELYKGCETYATFKKWLQEQGFTVIREDLPWQDAGNALFVRR